MSDARHDDGRAQGVQGSDLDNCHLATPPAAPTTHPTSTEVFELLAWAKASLVRFGRLDFLEAVDSLQDGAVYSGLVEEIGQDAVQAVMAREFGARLC